MTKSATRSINIVLVVRFHDLARQASKNMGSHPQQRIIVIGGGFAGVQTAKRLRKSLDKKSFEIVLYAQENHMVFYPLLAEVAVAAISPKDMAAPLRQLLPGVQCRTESVTEIDPKSKIVRYENIGGATSEITYDQLVIACGNMTNLAFIPGMADHAFSLKSTSDALRIQAHIISQLEKAEVEQNASKRAKILTFIVVGGGFSGVELAGSLNDFLQASAKYYSNFTKKDIKVILVHSHDQILPEVSSSLRVFAKRKMEADGIIFKLNTAASACLNDGIRLKDGTVLHADTIICTIGSRPLPLIEKLDVKKERGRLIVSDDMSVPGCESVWAIGDCAAVKNAEDGEISPTTGQFAERQGDQVAKNILRRINNQETKPFSHKSLGTLCSIGGKSAVAETFGMHVSGFIAWFIWRGTYLFKLPSFAQKVKVGIAWACDVFFPPELTAIKIDDSYKIGFTHYDAGETIFKPGDAATDFYMIESGSVAVLSHSNDGQESSGGGDGTLVALLGAGEFFGERSLLQNRVHSHECRAHETCEIMVMGKNVFGRLSDRMLPFKQQLATAAKKRTNLFDNFPQLKRTLDRYALRDLIEPFPAPPVVSVMKLADCIHLMKSYKVPIIFVVNDQRQLVGAVKRSALLNWMESSMLTNNDRNYDDISVANVLDSNILSVKATATTSEAVQTMRSNGLNQIPVLDEKTGEILGVLRAENLIEKWIGERNEL